LLCAFCLLSLHLSFARWQPNLVRQAAQPTSMRVTNQCAFPLWVEARCGGQGGPLPGQVNTTTPLNAGTSVDYDIPAGGLVGSRFWGKYGCNPAGRECQIGDSVPYYPGGGCPTNGCTAPVDSLFEATWGCHPGATCVSGLTSLTWYDTSQVDGFTLPYKILVKGDTSGCDCAGKNCTLDASHLDLARCPTTENLSVNNAYPTTPQGASLQSVDLRILSRDGSAVIGCASPCKKLNWVMNQNEGSMPTLFFCCPTPNPSNCVESAGCITADECRTGPIEQTQWVADIHSMAPGIYSYAYDDGVGLHTCPAASVQFEMVFCPGGASYPHFIPQPGPASQPAPQ